MKQKRKIYDKVLKVKGLADSDSDDEISAADWVTKTREAEQRKKTAEESSRRIVKKEVKEEREEAG